MMIQSPPTKLNLKRTLFSFKNNTSVPKLMILLKGRKDMKYAIES